MASGLLDPAAMLVSLILLLAVLGLSTHAPAGEYDPPGLYDIDYFKLENGFDVVLKQRTQIHGASIRLAVNVGNRNFPCPKRETPHFLEHLLFMGTSKHSESELKRLIEDYGGSWNGYTSPTQTGYQIDIFDKHLPIAIDTLHEMMTDTVITPQTIESARAVIHRERSGKLSSLVQWAFEKGLFKSAVTKAGELLLPGPGVLCPGVISPEGIGERDVETAYENYYVPSNMTLVVVGNFDKGPLLSQIKSTFGRMKPKASKGTAITKPPQMNGSKEVTGTLSPIVGSDATLAFVYRTEGVSSPDNYALLVLWQYFKRAVYEKIRVEKALSYGPGSGYAVEEDFGVFLVGADVNFDKLDSVKALLQAEVENVKQGRANNEEIEATKRRILLERAQTYQSNDSIASYYLQNLYQLKTHGKLANYEALIAGVTPDDIRRVANKYLRDDARIVIRSTPTLTYAQFLGGLGVLIVGVPGSSVFLIRRFFSKTQERVHHD